MIAFERDSQARSCEQCHDRVAKYYSYFTSLAAGPISGPVKLEGLSNLHHTVRSDEVQPGSQLMVDIFRNLTWPPERGVCRSTLSGASLQTIQHKYRATALIIILKIRAAEALLCQELLQSGGGKNPQEAMLPH